MNYIQEYFKGAEKASEKYIKDYLLIKNYFQSLGFITLPTRPYLYTNIPNDSYYKNPVTNHSFKDIKSVEDFSDDFALYGLERGEIGLAIYPKESLVEKGIYLSILDVDSLTGLELEEFKKYLDYKNMPFVLTKKGVHVYGTSTKEIQGRNGVTITIGDFIVRGEIRSSGSGYCLVPPSNLITLDSDKGAYRIGNSIFLELVVSGDMPPLWDSEMLRALTVIDKTSPLNTKAGDLLKVLKGTAKGRGDGVYDLNLREIGRVVNKIKKEKLLDDPASYRKGLDEVLLFNSKHLKGYSESEVEATYDDIYRKEIERKTTSKGNKKRARVEEDIDIVLEQGVKIVQDQNTEDIYLRINGNKNLQLGGNECTRWLTKIIEPENKAQIANLEMRINAMASDIVDIRTRIVRNGAIYYNLANNGKVVKITQECADRGVLGSVEVIEDEGLENFKTVSGEKPQVIPDITSDVSNVYKIFDYLNVDEPLRPMIICCIVAYLTPDIDYPILNIYGEKGSGKSTMADLIKDLVDPNTINLESADQNKEDNLIITLNNGYVTIFDNIYKITKDFGDMLTKVSTGIGFRTRTLFTNKGVTTFRFRKPIIITSVGQEMVREDLISRSMMIESIPFNGNIIPESKLREGFYANKDIILGAFFNILSKVDFAAVNQTNLIRLTDFHIICRSVEKIMGWEEGLVDTFLRENLTIQEEESLEQSEVGEFITKYIQEQLMGRDTEITTKKLFDTLSSIYGDFKFKVKNIAVLGKELTKIQGTMKYNGFILEKIRIVNGKKARGWLIGVKKD